MIAKVLKRCQAAPRCSIVDIPLVVEHLHAWSGAYCPLETMARERPYILFKNNCILSVVVARERASSCARTIASGSEQVICAFPHFAACPSFKGSLKSSTTIGSYKNIVHKIEYIIAGAIEDCVSFKKLNFGLIKFMKKICGRRNIRKYPNRQSVDDLLIRWIIY